MFLEHFHRIVDTIFFLNRDKVHHFPLIFIIIIIKKIMKLYPKCRFEFKINIQAKEDLMIKGIEELDYRPRENRQDHCSPPS